MANEQNLKPLDSKRAAEVGRKGGFAKKGSKHINTWVQNLLHDEEFTAMVREGYQIKEFKGAPLPAIIKAQIIKAINGDTKAYDSLVKSGWATKQEIEHSGAVDTGTIDPALAEDFAEFMKNKTKS